MKNSVVQQMAKDTMAFAMDMLRPGMTLVQLRDICEVHLRELGAEGFWYYDIGAFVFAGEDTVRSVSGREYMTPAHVIGMNDIITVDLSPQHGSMWGDYARTLVIENGVVKKRAEEIENARWMEGIRIERLLHEELLRRIRRLSSCMFT